MTNLKTLSGLVVIFDLDGTLVDSAPDLAGAMNHVLITHGHTPLNREDVRNLVGNGAKALILRGLQANGITLKADDESLDVMVEEFVDWYKNHIADHSFIFPNVIPILKELRENGAHLAVCTNKREDLARRLLTEIKLIEYFDVIIGRDTLPTYKPAPEPLLTCLDQTQCTKAVMVGDTMTDVMAAEAANIPCLFATFGYGKLSDSHAKKTRKFDSFHAFPSLEDL